jgi:hypothetical protein
MAVSKGLANSGGYVYGGVTVLSHKFTVTLHAFGARIRLAREARSHSGHHQRRCGRYSERSLASLAEQPDRCGEQQVCGAILA